MKKEISLTTSCLLLIAGLTSCDTLKPDSKDCREERHSHYTFDLPIYYSPDTDTMRIGDTLWIESRFDNQFYNERNGKTYTLNNFELLGFLNDLSANPIAGCPHFILIDTLGQLDTSSKNGAFFKLDYIYSGNDYYWKRGVILNKAGIFYIDMFSFKNADLLSNTGQSIMECSNEYIDIRDKRMNNSSNDYLAEISSDPYIKQGEEVFRDAFVFYVRE